MSKKKRRKTVKKEEIIRRGKFTIDDSKLFVIALIVMFHIAPLLFVFMGENGQLLLMTYFLVQLNPLFIAVTGLIYGVKKGFNMKFPIIMAVFAAVSVPMYYQFDSAQYMTQTIIIETIVYVIFSYLATAVGAFVKRWLDI